MKEKFLSISMNYVKKHHKDYDKIKLEKIHYYLESFYLSFSKLIIIFGLAFILGIVKEMILMIIVFNILRSSAFGLHATKGWICLLSSSIVFLTFPFLSKIITIPFILKTILGISAILLSYLYAPADTKKHPLIYKEDREKYKFKTTIKCIILVFVSLIIKNNVISNLFIFGIWSEIIVIVPVAYKIFNLDYNNYETYIIEHQLG